MCDYDVIDIGTIKFNNQTVSLPPAPIPNPSPSIHANPKLQTKFWWVFEKHHNHHILPVHHPSLTHKPNVNRNTEGRKSRIITSLNQMQCSLLRTVQASCAYVLYSVCGAFLLYYRLWAPLLDRGCILKLALIFLSLNFSSFDTEVWCAEIKDLCSKGNLSRWLLYKLDSWHLRRRLAIRSSSMVVRSLLPWL